MKVKPEYEQETLIKIRDELNFALDELVSADLRISLLNTVEDNNNLAKAHILIMERLVDICDAIKDKE